jgi:ADP-heptose:LPS heptosyltransferase
LKRFLSSLITPDPLGSSPQILVLQLKRIGELILTAPALHKLRETWPEARITLVTSMACEALVPALPRVDEVLVFRESFRQNKILFQRLLTGTFDVCLDFTGTDRSALFAMASRARRRVAFASAHKGWVRGLIYQNFVNVSTSATHVADYYVELLRAIGLQSTGGEMQPALRVPPIAIQRARILLRECGIADAFAVIHPGAREESHYWPAERWAEFILHLQISHQMPCVLVGGAGVSEQNHLRDIRTALAVLGAGPLPQPLVTLAGQLDLMLLTALVARARLIASCDNLLVQMGAALTRPQIGLFGPTNPFAMRPRHSAARIISARHASQPLSTFSPSEPGAPMAEISTQVVSVTADALLADGTTAPPIYSARQPDSRD